MLRSYFKIPAAPQTVRNQDIQNIVSESGCVFLINTSKYEKFRTFPLVSSMFRPIGHHQTMLCTWYIVA
jgi:hypothetical protein